MAASVASAPVTHKAIEDRGTIGRRSTGDSCPHRSGAADRRRPVGQDREPDPRDPPGDGVERGRRPGATAGRTASGNTTPETRNMRAGEGIGIGPALLARLEADRREQHAQREDRDEAEHEAGAEQRPVDGREVDPQAEDDDGEHERDDGPHRTRGEACPAAPDEQHEERRRADVQVLEHPVALAVLEHGPRRSRDPGDEHRPQGAAEHDERPDVAVRAAADDLDHHHQEEQRGDRPRDGVDEEQERVGPVGLDAPAEHQRGAQVAHRVGGPAALGPGGSNVPAPVTSSAAKALIASGSTASRGRGPSARWCGSASARPG